MAEKRMFARSVIGSDAFTDMPLSTQALYFHLGMYADDDGFVDSPRKIQRSIGCSDDDMKLLIAKGFIIPFEDGIIVITHWRVNNYLRCDRYTPTRYAEHKSQLSVSTGNLYELSEATHGIPVGIPKVGQLSPSPYTQNSKVKGSEEDGISAKVQRKRFTPPTLEEIQAFMAEYSREKGLLVDVSREAEAFMDYYASNGWRVGRNKMQDWRATIRTWLKRASGSASVEPVAMGARRVLPDVDSSASIADLYGA
ncbi:MAG: replisome organizer [Candidatus Faecivicinus sp.]